ncbi:hypothetical protein RCH21_003402 [Arthrobacter sp. PL16]|uniref:hypothetical protein n=1 Tax=Arthrobacter sp. PL16 TaxID=3071720 RepID=UPI002E0A4EA3|nr:hypothetical protein [Arthrobacter sp. PL16]
METHAVERSETTESDLWEMAADTIAGISEECRAALIRETLDNCQGRSAGQVVDLMQDVAAARHYPTVENSPR